jgi:hypothetical protein
VEALFASLYESSLAKGSHSLVEATEAGQGSESVLPKLALSQERAALSGKITSSFGPRLRSTAAHSLGEGSPWNNPFVVLKPGL